MVLLEGGHCDCKFYRAYQIPCCHVFTAIQDDGFEPDWEAYYFMWEDCGFETYEGMTKEYISNDIYDEIGAPARRKIALRETWDTTLSGYYKVEEYWATAAPEEAEAYVGAYVQKHRELNSELIRYAQNPELLRQD